MGYGISHPKPLKSPLRSSGLQFRHLVEIWERASISVGELPFRLLCYNEKYESNRPGLTWSPTLSFLHPTLVGARGRTGGYRKWERGKHCGKFCWRRKKGVFSPRKPQICLGPRSFRTSATTSRILPSISKLERPLMTRKWNYINGRLLSPPQKPAMASTILNRPKTVIRWYVKLWMRKYWWENVENGRCLVDRVALWPCGEEQKHLGKKRFWQNVVWILDLCFPLFFYTLWLTYFDMIFFDLLLIFPLRFEEKSLLFVALFPIFPLIFTELPQILVGEF